MRPNKATPMIRQYLEIKEQYPDAILFYRMGDFYEMFFEDANVASRILEITLTSRNKNDESPIPMCGVPWKAAQGYIAKLLEQGKKVAICDQVEDSAEAKGLVKRDVVRVVTPGMIVEDEMLDAKSNNYILAVTRKSRTFGLSYLDISTATFRLAETQSLRTVVEEALRIGPSELLLPVSAESDNDLKVLIESLPERSVTFIEDKAFDFRRGRKQLLDLFKTLSLEGFGCESLKVGVSAAGGLVHYVGETQKQSVEHLVRIETYHLDDFLILDDITFRNLEVIQNLRTGTRTGTLIDVIDQTVTAMGGRMFKQWLKYPLMDVDQINHRLDAVQEAVEHRSATKAARTALKAVADLERLGSKISLGQANARDLVALKRSLFRLPEVQTHLAEFKSRFYRTEDDGSELADLARLIDAAVRDDPPPSLLEGGLIRDGYNPELDELISISRDGKGYLARLEADQRAATGINSLKVRFNKVFGYYIEISKIHQEAVPDHYVRKQTLVNAERYITDELKEFEAKVLGAEDRRAKLEYEIFNILRREVMAHHQSVQEAALFVARLDCLLALSEIAAQNDYTRPGLTDDGRIHIEDGRHPVVEKMITAERFIPNTVDLDNQENQVLIITGPNMAGKSTILRQVALVVLMAQMGSFVPAKKAAISLTDRIFSRVGALDNLSSGQSTFMVEMQETANILNNATPQSLVIMDEIGRGTSTYDGFSIAWAVADHLHDLNGEGVKTLFATHYHELTELSRSKTRVRNYNIAVKEWNDEIIFLRKLAKGGTNRSYGIQVARLAGVPDPVIDEAKRILAEIETGGDHFAGALTARLSQQQEKSHVQISLFQKPQDLLVNKLRQLDIDRMTPLEALSSLSALKEEILKYEPK
jgi:DNA mismatch repair protein MutS